MNASRGDREDSRATQSDPEVVIDADTGGVSITLDRTHSLLSVIRDAHRTPPPPVVDEDPRHEVFERELRMLLRMTRRDSHYSEEELLGTRDQLLDRIQTAEDLEPLFDEMIDSVLTERTVEACVEKRFYVRLLAAVLSVYRPDIYTSGALEIGQHFYGRAERTLVMEGAISEYELQQAL